MHLKSRITKLGVYQAGKPIEEVQKEYGLKKVIKLASNENPYGCSPTAIAAGNQFLNELAIYPDSNATLLKSKLASHLNVKETQFLLGNGSDEIIQLLCRSILHEGTNSVMADITFPQYKHNSLVEGAEVREIPLIDGYHDLDGMAHVIDEQTKIVWICNPNNPTGTYVNESSLRAFLNKVPSTCLVVIDEAYVEYAAALDFPQSISLLEEFDNVLLLRTFSKGYGLASCRVGYAIGNEKLMGSLNIVRAPFNVGRLSQAIATAALDDQAFIQETHIKNRTEMERYYHFCDQKGLAYFPSQTNFLLFEVKQSGEILFEKLLREGIIIRPGEKLGYPNYIRVTIGKKEENDIVLSTLDKFITS
ncbi:histidinol-phosphate transaminase [Lottiidibacillus patelloidae]|uniref:Histidinol-phosphate aminotransferase n=1 Tax=Lottiidibacillus patelloidae TaxID=2670334 RepID=A0A263BUN0_9BACI|nr:histidinol-phosphate transaminase [Lottiidibacillus patelloidae]OZM57278.1 histidinol-phosphate transaminase [Lottiidibacillus patelloidae]